MTAHSVSKICSVEGCDRPFRKNKMCVLHDSRRRRNGTLSLSCYSPLEDFTTFFWSQADVVADITQCWRWKRPLYNGYGNMRYLGRTRKAHVVAWSLTHGRLPSLFILHRCDNRACVNPHHLYEGTQAQNMADMVARGRSTAGEKSATAKLTVDQVKQIRELSQLGRSSVALSRQFHVTKQSILAIIHRKNWRHVN